MGKPGEETVTLTRDELNKLITGAVEAAAAAAVKVQRDVIGLEGMTATAEEKTAREIGRPIPSRTPFRELHQRWTHPDLGVTCTARIKVREHDADGRKLEKPVLTVVENTIDEWPADLVERCKLPKTAKEAGPGGGGKFVEYPTKNGKISGWWSMPFLQWVADTYTKPLASEFASGKDPVHLKAYTSEEPKVRDLGEVRRERGAAI